MHKSFPLLMLTSIVALQQQVNGWSKNQVQVDESAKTEAIIQSINNPDHRMIIIEADYLFWKPYQDDLFYAIKTVQSVDPTNAGVTTFKVTPKTPDFDLSSGVRLGIGGYTGDRWDIAVRGTYFYTDGSSQAQRQDSTDVIYPSYYPGYEGSLGTKASGSWKLNLGLIDFIMGREYHLTRKVSFHPFIGIRNAWINQTFKGRFSGLAFSGGAGSDTAYTFSKFNNNMWGIGPRAGLDLAYYFTKSWSFRGGLSGSLVYGHFHVDQKATILKSVSNDPRQTKMRTKDSENLIRSNLDAYFGIGWDQWFNDCKNRIYVALLCETSYWYHINQYMDVTTQQYTLPNSNSSSYTQANKRNGDLAFFGGTIHFQVDF